jgi:hypothetical protein
MTPKRIAKRRVELPDLQAGPSRLRISRCYASELMGGWSDRQFDRLEREGLLTPVYRRRQVFYYVDDFRAILQPASKLSKKLAYLKHVAPNGEVSSLSVDGAHVIRDGWPFTLVEITRKRPA